MADVKRLWRRGLPNVEITTLEKELEDLRSKPPGSDLVSVLNRLAYASFHSDPHTAEAHALEAQDLSEKQGLLSDLAKSCSTLGSINHQAGNFAEAMSYSRKSIGIYEELGDINGMASVLSVMARVYWS